MRRKTSYVMVMDGWMFTIVDGKKRGKTVQTYNGLTKQKLTIRCEVLALVEYFKIFKRQVIKWIKRMINQSANSRLIEYFGVV